MKNSITRVHALINGEQPDRPPIFELLRNDAVLTHFSGERLTIENAERVVFGAYEPAVDATRPAVRLPGKEETMQLDDGREQRNFRWTAWTEHVRYESDDEYVTKKRELLRADPAEWGKTQVENIDRYFRDVDDHRRRLGEVFFVPGGRSPGLMKLITESGLEQFIYRSTDHPGLIDELLEHQTVSSVSFIEHLPDDHGLELVIVGEDIAYKTGPMFAPNWFDEFFFSRLARVVEAYHRKGIKVLFHSDGNLNEVLGGLVEAGINGLNPIETLAGMDIRNIHSRFPDLFMVGGIDVSQLLPFGTPDDIRRAVRKAIEDAEGKIMIGSSTELNNDVPLENYLALREAVLES
ncbi:MAG: hypothetical protein HN368_07445 [Spirochaetales bacterium]|jgi:hypothetical protein|nr:hypothetical protein [Spirochaetales bacterium]